MRNTHQKPLRSGLLETLLHDLRFGLRTLAKSPVFTVTVVLTLALGIGANSAIFTLVDAVILRRLSVERPEELHVLGTGSRMGRMTDDTGVERSSNLFSVPLFRDLREHGRVFTELAAISSYPVDVYLGAEQTGSGAALERVEARLVSGNFFELLGLGAARGRLITDEDDRVAGGHPVAVLSHGLWTRRFGGADDILGRTIHLSGAEYTIVGVAPQGFKGVTVGLSTDLWVPVTMQAQLMREESFLEDRGMMWLRLIGRLDPRVDPESATTAINELFRRLVAEGVGGDLSPESRAEIAKLETRVTPFATGFSPLRQRYSQPLMLLMAVVGFVLIIACANVGNLQLARAANREGEVAVRVALGSTRRRLVGQLLAESLILALLGGMVGILVGRWTISLLLRLISTRGLPLDVGIDHRILAFTLTVSLLTALLTGLAPALRATRLDPGAALKSHGGVAGGSSFGWGLREALLVSQVAISLPLLIAAGLFLRTLDNLREQETGFSPEGVLLVEIDPQGGGYDEGRQSGLYRDLVERIEASPGVESASLAYSGPLGRGRWVNLAYVDGQGSRSNEEREMEIERTTPGYFATIGASVVEGRPLDDRDRDGAPHVAVVNEAFARKFFGGSSPVGRYFGTDSEENTRQFEIVGLVRDFKQHDLRREVAAMAYFPVAQNPTSLESIQVKAAGPRASDTASSLVPQLRRTLAEVAPDLPIRRITSLTEMMEITLRQEKMLSQLTGLFGLLALVMVSLGLYGVVAYGVTRRTREIGIRMALGALRGQVVWAVLRAALYLVGIGVAIGLIVALALGRFLSSLLYGLDPSDPGTLLAAGATLLAVALLAGYWPARRASLMDPATTLHHD